MYVKICVSRLAQGISLDVVTIRKLTVQPDAYTFAEAVLDRWYPNDEDKSKDKDGVAPGTHGLLLMVSA